MLLHPARRAPPQKVEQGLPEVGRGLARVGLGSAGVEQGSPGVGGGAGGGAGVEQGSTTSTFFDVIASSTGTSAF